MNNRSRHMGRYFIHNGTDEDGPFDKNELRARTIKPDTPVWCEGMTDWTAAGAVDDLKDLFVAPPPFKGSGESASTQAPSADTERAARNAKADKKIGRYLQLIGLIGVLVIGGGVAYDWLDSRNAGRGASYQERVMTVEEIERADPSRFLEASGTWNTNFWGNRLKIHGTVTSSATVAKFKDVRIRVRYLSATETVLGTDDYVLYDFVPAHSTVNFEWTIDKPSSCEKLGWDVISATPI